MKKVTNIALTTLLSVQGGWLFGAVIPVTDANLLKGLSACNWVCKPDSISSTAAGHQAIFNTAMPHIKFSPPIHPKSATTP